MSLLSVLLLRSQILDLTCNVFTLVLVAKDVNILFDELEAVNSPCKDDDSLLHPGNLTSTSDDASRLEAGGEVRVCHFIKTKFLIHARTGESYSSGLFKVISLNWGERRGEILHAFENLWGSSTFQESEIYLVQNRLSVGHAPLL